MPVRYTMIATQNGTTTVTWPNIGSPDTGGTGPHVPSGTLTNIRILDKKLVTESWQNMDSALIPGTVQALYDFEGDFTDSSGNGIDLTLQGGGASLFTTEQGLQMGRIAGSGVYLQSATAAALQLTGAMSVWMICFYPTVPNAGGTILCSYRSINAFPQDLAHNRLYELQVLDDTGRLRYNCERDAGTDHVAVFSTAIIPQEMMFISWSRDGSGDTTFFVNGVQYGPVSTSPSGLPNGGTSTDNRLVVGSDPDFGTTDIFVGGLAIADALHTLDDHTVMYDYVRGLI